MPDLQTITYHIVIILGACQIATLSLKLVDLIEYLLYKKQKRR